MPQFPEPFSSPITTKKTHTEETYKKVFNEKKKKKEKNLFEFVSVESSVFWWKSSCIELRGNEKKDIKIAFVLNLLTKYSLPK